MVIKSYPLGDGAPAPVSLPFAPPSQAAATRSAPTSQHRTQHIRALSFSLAAPPAGPCVMCGRAQAEAAITLLDGNLACARHLAYFCPLLHPAPETITENASGLQLRTEDSDDELEYVDSIVPVTPITQPTPFNEEPRMPSTPEKPSVQTHTAVTRRIASLTIDASSWQRPSRQTVPPPSPPPKAPIAGKGKVFTAYITLAKH
ncbi:hypothetical protein FRC04_009520 [Tulasnella sp. 424]|nr:hypothetical protein FRC04_009520 [Tulasnella sp. 424]